MQDEYRAIRDLAYRLWESRGCPQGSADQDWLEAERQILTAPTVSQAVKPVKPPPKRKAPPTKPVSSN
jgi:Protein of unknown function (DUF2934)